jgi:hypothetical protein
MTLKWRDAVLAALHRYTARNRTAKIERKAFLGQELSYIAQAVGSIGRTPAQTVSRVLQELRDEGRLFFSSAGVYVFADQSINLTQEDLDPDIVEHAISRGILIVPDFPVTDAIGEVRLRVGTEALRRLTLINYGGRCALCDTADKLLLVTSHIARWADCPDARGKLSNTICLCALHDRLFEVGYFGLRDDFTILRRSMYEGSAIHTWLTQCTSEFQMPRGHQPSIAFLDQHRRRVGLQAEHSPPGSQ